ncbi:hypothetical protein [Streptomyces sp. NPDC058964]|uniref:hypothetical protein n=1 Tax=Streptomyces sp. NPDC058964 TaxID=3346681 RepID=UPI00369F8720
MMLALRGSSIDAEVYQDVVHPALRSPARPDATVTASAGYGPAVAFESMWVLCHRPGNRAGRLSRTRLRPVPAP